MDRDDLDWDALYRLHAPRLRRRMARRVADPAIVDDVVQETFIQAYRRWSTYDQSRSLWPWLVTIAVNRGWRWSQASQRAGQVVVDDGIADGPLLDYLQAGSDDHVANLHRRRAMRAALDGMTEKHRRILLAWELGDRSVSDLAAAEGMTTEELRATVVRARRSLRQRYLAAAGESAFGVVVGLGHLLSRWRDKLTRAASTSGWAEAASSLAAAPVVAIAGMAMITLVPAPPSQAPPPGSLAERPTAVLHDAVPEPVADGASAAAAVVSTPSATTPSAAPPVAEDPTAAASSLAAGPAAASVATTPDSNRTDLAVDGPNGGADSRRWNAVNCEYSVATRAVCQVGEALPNQE